jgi:hypothetical protein
MIRALTLLLPALVPSWRFFPKVGASPRIEFALLGSPDEGRPRWQEFCPRPDHLPLSAMMGRLVWNPTWNEHLYLVTCSERFLHGGIEARGGELLCRLGAHLRRSIARGDAAQYFQMRLLLVSRDGQDRLVREEVYRSAVQPLNGVSPA